MRKNILKFINKLLMKHLPERVEPVRAFWGDSLFFTGTPLTLAAALGRREQVELLLAAGVQPDEIGKGGISRFSARDRHCFDNHVAVTPVLAAILFGQEETARQLLAAGAVCDFSRRDHRNVLYFGSAESLALAERLPGTAFSAIPSAELEAIRVAVEETGSRTKFWHELRQTEP